ncbi:hypothetical protein ES711_05060 [Gelidibacter salicanalis]|uniref:Uncharacterized protein n=1 Tax=Gelidibacter salicanalis TaxID=291193 RepID=A0A5C7ALJ0_9FLAO|nr:hypothetical protein [Gelidibacter salicanalis]TXE09301.1 hypothetical protein ES711_05060 [Gelidibacter salicanalis]
MTTQPSKPIQVYISITLGKVKARVIAVFLALAVLNVSISCSYYSVKNVPTTKETMSQQVKTFNDAQKYVMLHTASETWHLKNMVINEDDQTLSGILEDLSDFHTYTKPRESKRVHRYDKDETMPLTEVHFYLNNSLLKSNNDHVQIPLADIVSISVNDKNTNRTIANIALTTVGVVFVVFIIIMATKSSCPFVYIKNGAYYDFVGELYPGTITATMQRDDYLPLGQLAPEDDGYTLKIANLLKEIQYTDFLQLILVNHDEDVQVLMDSKGDLQTFKNILAPSKATQDDGFNMINPALKKDNEYYAFNTSKVTETGVRSIVFEFDKPKNDQDAKLYLTAKNSVWLDYIFGKFNAQFGSYYNTFKKKQQTVAAKTITDWSQAQNIPLSVYIKTRTGWQLVERIQTVGPMAMRDLVVPLKLNQIEGDKLQIKLETGFMFWEVDYVGVDFSENNNVELSYVSPSKALDQNGEEVTHLLAAPDGIYVVQPNIGDEVVVHFKSKPYGEGQTQSVFLQNRGYYNYIRDYKGTPDVARLKVFKEDNMFTKFSEKAYFEFVNFNFNEFASHD